jgi:hypothetical protein
MRQQNKFAGRYRSKERGFVTEAQFLKFVKPRNEDNMPHLVCSMPNFSTNTTVIEVSETTEINRPVAITPSEVESHSSSVIFQRTEWIQAFRHEEAGTDLRTP